MPESELLGYSPEEEARAVRKVDLLVLPCIILMFLHLQFVGLRSQLRELNI